MNQLNDVSDETPMKRNPPDAMAGGIDLRTLTVILWRGRLFIFIIILISAVLSAIISILLPNQYKATALLIPASSSQSSDFLQLTSQSVGLASLAGIGLNGTDRTSAAIALIKSWGFQDKFIRDNHIEVEVFAADGWNRASQTLNLDPKIYDVSRKMWVRRFDSTKGETAEPNSWELFRAFSKRIDVSEDKATGLVTLSVEYFSPELAQQWVDKIAAAVNTWFRDQDRTASSKSIEYLKQQIGKTSVSEMQTVFYKLIEEQTKNLMLADVKDEYVLKTLSPAQPPRERSKPKRALIVAASTLLSALLGCLLVLLRSAHKDYRK